MGEGSNYPITSLGSAPDQFIDLFLNNPIRAMRNRECTFSRYSYKMYFMRYKKVVAGTYL